MAASIKKKLQNIVRRSVHKRIFTGSDEFYMENGKLLLEERISLFHGKTNPFRCFSADELNAIIIEGNHDLWDEFNWYDSVIDGRPVVIRVEKNKVGNLSRDIAVSAQMSSHKNVHKLLGCCLETEHPILVYESVANGSLHNRIHGNVNQNATPLEWKDKLRIAWEISHVVSYLHTYFPRPIIHRDLKPGNVLLDQDNAAKLTNFSLCISIPKGKTSLEVDRLAGTYGYMAPEYRTNYKLVEKSDVYSFGVLFLELLTGQKPNDWYTAMESSNNAMEYSGDQLDMSFKLLVRKFVEDNISKIISSKGTETPNEHLHIQQLQESIDLALRCMVRPEENRPTMEEVATQLKNIIASSSTSIPTTST